jgi:hypothetical protein
MFEVGCLPAARGEKNVVLLHESANCTTAAERSGTENVELLREHPDAAAHYEERLRLLWSHSDDHGAVRSSDQLSLLLHPVRDSGNLVPSRIRCSRTPALGAAASEFSQMHHDRQARLPDSAALHRRPDPHLTAASGTCLVQALDDRRVQGESRRCEKLAHLRKIRRAGDRRGHAWAGHQPGERDGGGR